MPPVDSFAIAARLMGKHCAGAAVRPSPQALLAYLSGPAEVAPGPASPNAFAARCVLNASSVTELLELLVDCSIPPQRLSAHAHALDVTNAQVLACLEQLAQ